MGTGSVGRSEPKHGAGNATASEAAAKTTTTNEKGKAGGGQRIVIEDGLDDAAATGMPPKGDPLQPQPRQPVGPSTVQRSFELLAARRNMDPLARSYRHGSIPRASFDAPRTVRDAYYSNVFSASERAQIDAYYQLPLAERRERYREIMQLCDTPDKVAALLGTRFTWVDEHDGAETWSAAEMIATGRGVCRDQHNAAREILQMHGYTANEVGYADGAANHAVLVFQDKADGKWYLMDYDGLIHPEGADSRRELLEGIDAGNFAWRVYEDTDGRPGAFSERIWTRAGLQTLGFMHGTPSGHQGLSGLSPSRFDSTATESFDGWRAETTGEHVTLGLRRGKWEVDLRQFTSSAGTTMEDAFAAAVRFSPEMSGDVTDANLSLTLMHLPNRGSRQVGGGDRNGTQPLTMLGIAGNETLQPYNWEAVDDHLFLAGDLDLRGAAVIGYNHASGGIDNSTPELANAQITWRNLLEYRANDPSDRWGLRAFAGPTVNVDLVQVAGHYRTGGSGAPPFNAFVEAGLEGAYENLALGGRLYLPLETTSNLFREDPAWEIYGGFHLNDFRLLATASGSLAGDREGLQWAGGGVGYKWFSAQAGYNLETKDPTVLLQASFRF